MCGESNSAIRKREKIDGAILYTWTLKYNLLNNTCFKGNSQEFKQNKTLLEKF